MTQKLTPDSLRPHQFDVECRFEAVFSVEILLSFRHSCRAVDLFAFDLDVHFDTAVRVDRRVVDPGKHGQHIAFRIKRQLDVRAEKEELVVAAVFLERLLQPVHLLIVDRPDRQQHDGARIVKEL